MLPYIQQQIELKQTDKEVDTNGSLMELVKPGLTIALRRRPGRRFDKTKLRRRCSINGHYYNRETSVFTPPYGIINI